MAKLRMAHASTHGARKPPGSKRKKERERERLNDGDNNGQAMHGACMAHASTHGACKPHASRLGQNAWRTQASMAHASRQGQFGWIGLHVKFCQFFLLIAPRFGPVYLIGIDIVLSARFFKPLTKIFRSSHQGIIWVSVSDKLFSNPTH